MERCIVIKRYYIVRDVSNEPRPPMPISHGEPLFMNSYYERSPLTTPQTSSRHEVPPQRRRPLHTRPPKPPLNLPRTPRLLLELRPSRLPSSLRKPHPNPPRHRRPPNVAKLRPASHLGRVPLLRRREHQIRRLLPLLHKPTSSPHPPLDPPAHNELPRRRRRCRLNDTTTRPPYPPSPLGAINNPARHLARQLTSSLSTQRQTPPPHSPPLQHNNNNPRNPKPSKLPNNRTLLPHPPNSSNPDPLPLRPHPAPPTPTHPHSPKSKPKLPAINPAIPPLNLNPSPLARPYHHRHSPRPPSLLRSSGNAAAPRSGGELS